MGKILKIIAALIVSFIVFVVGIQAGRTMLPPADQETVDAAIEQTVTSWPTSTPLPTYTPQPTSAPLIITVERVIERQVVVTVIPSSPTLPVSLTATRISTTPTLEPITFVVRNTGGDGVYLRKTIEGGERLSAWPDGTELSRIGRSVTGQGQIWEHVRAPDGNEGYVPQAYLVSSQELARIATQEARPKTTAKTVQVQSDNTCTTATRQYIASLESSLKPLLTSITGIGSLSQQASTNPRLLFDEDWRLEYVIYLAGLNVASQELIDMNAPSDGLARKIHSNMISAARRYQESTTLIAQGLDEFDESTLKRGAQKLTQGTKLVEQSANLIKDCA